MKKIFTIVAASFLFVAINLVNATELFLKEVALSASNPRYLYFWAHREEFPPYENEPYLDDTLLPPDQFGLFAWDLESGTLHELEISKVYGTYLSTSPGSLVGAVFYSKGTRFPFRFNFTHNGLEISHKRRTLRSDAYWPNLRSLNQYPPDRVAELQLLLNKGLSEGSLIIESAKDPALFYSESDPEVNKNNPAKQNSEGKNPHYTDFVSHVFIRGTQVLVLRNSSFEMKTYPRDLMSSVLFVDLEKSSYSALQITGESGVYDLSPDPWLDRGSFNVQSSALPQRSVALEYNNHGALFWDPRNPIKPIAFSAVRDPELIAEIAGKLLNGSYRPQKVSSPKQPLLNFDFFEAPGFDNKNPPLVAIERDADMRPLRAMIGGPRFLSDFGFDFIETEFEGKLAGSLRMRHNPQVLEMDSDFVHGHVAAKEIWIPAHGLSEKDAKALGVQPFPWVRVGSGKRAKLHPLGLNVAAQRLGDDIVKTHAQCLSVLREIMGGTP